jgi:FkbM family methyltransferase
MSPPTLKKAAKTIIPKQYHQFVRNLKYRLWDTSLRSYSQQGEDIILRWLFDGVEKGFYVDVGAHHPVLYSNTYFFYRLGWQGINIDATPGSMDLFRSIRPRDTNLEFAISNAKKELTLYIFEQGALNTFSEELATARAKERPNSLVCCKRVVTRSLAEVLREHCPGGCPIEFLNVDVEGFDLDVLESNDWGRFAPRAVLCEDLLVQDMDLVAHSAVGSFLRARGYTLLSKCINTLIFVQRGKGIDGTVDLSGHQHTQRGKEPR